MSDWLRSVHKILYPLIYQYFERDRRLFVVLLSSVVSRNRLDDDPDPDPYWHQSSAEPHVDLPKFYTCWKIRFYFTFSHSVSSLQCFAFLIIVKCVKISVFLTAYWIFRKKVIFYRLFSYVWKWYLSGSGKMMRIRPDPIWIRIHNTG